MIKPRPQVYSLPLFQRQPKQSVEEEMKLFGRQYLILALLFGCIPSIMYGADLAVFRAWKLV